MTALNKNSQYIQSLVSYILDTKPYHSKLTDVVEEYQFFDSMRVNFSELTSVKSKTNPTWLYNFFSSGDPTFNTMQLKRLNTSLAKVFPSNTNTTYGAEKAFRDENTDLSNIPFVYSKKAFDGPGVANVLVERNGIRSTTEAMIEGLDYFQSHGSFQFRVMQTTAITSSGLPQFIPLWAETRSTNLISTASAQIRRLANDNTRPESALRQIRSLLNQIDVLTLSPTAQAILTPMITALNVTQNYTALKNSAIADGVSTASAYNGYRLIEHLQNRFTVLSAGTINLMNALLVILDSVILTRDYEQLLNQLIADSTAPLVGYAGWIGENSVPNPGPVPPRSLYVDEQLSAFSPSMYFYLLGDSELYESGIPAYKNVSSSWLNISQITISASTPAGDSWRVVCQDDAKSDWGVFSNITGFIGSFIAEEDPTFISSTISFTIQHVLQCPTIGETLRILNSKSRLVIDPAAPLEAWDIIKVNPLAYTRPALVSTRYGYIQNLVAARGTVSLILPSANTLETGTIVLTATSSTSFNITSVNNPTYSGTAVVGTVYNDGKLGFTIIAGSVRQFVAGDRFYIPIVNEPAAPIDFDIGYGYDLDSYDNPSLKYDTSQLPNKRVNFVYDTRFVDYNVAQLNLQIAQSAISGRSWRLRAIPNITRPISTLKKDGTTSNAIDLQAATSGIAPDPAVGAAAVFETIGQISNSVPDLLLYYADSFRLEWSIDEFNTAVDEGIVPIDTPYSNPALGLSFTLPTGTRPFVAVVSDNAPSSPTAVQGGDVFSFTILNNDVYISETLIGLTSVNSPQLIMHGDGFHEVLPAIWTVAFSSSTGYTVTGIQTEGSPGAPVPGSPRTGSISSTSTSVLKGFSFNDLGVHFTIVSGSNGFASGDILTFRTFSRKPTYLVHGSASGWQPEAVVGEPYWNGIIGFEIQKPKADLYNPAKNRTVTPLLPALPFQVPDPLMLPDTENSWSVGTGSLSLSRLRFDAPSLSYTLTPTPIGSSAPTGWIVHREDVGAVGYIGSDGSFSDQYITLTADSVPAVSVLQYTLRILSDDFTLWGAQDTVLLRPSIVEKLPSANDFVLIDKRTNDSFGLSLGYDSVSGPPSLAPLAPFTLNISNTAPIIIDTFTGSSGVPLSNTSPETAILRNWLPITIVSYDNGTSIAQFSDPATSHVILSAGSGEVIGTISASSTNQNWPTQFKWDTAFFQTYLPLNAEANLVTYGSGFNDVIRARISESVKFLINGGALTTDFLFSDEVSVNLDEILSWTITQETEETISTLIADGPFGGFLAGYDNTPYDLSPTEDINGNGSDVFNSYPNGYDSGFPLTSHFHEARQLAGIDQLTPFQATQTSTDRSIRLAQLLGLIDVYLDNHDLASTTLGEFLANINANSGIDIITDSFGIPAIGMGMEITIGATGADVREPSTEGASTSIQDAMIITAIDRAVSFDTFGFDVGGFDAAGSLVTLLSSGSLPPVPNPLSVLTTYAAFETPFEIDIPSSTFEISFVITATNLAVIQTMPTPKVFIWLPIWAAPKQASVVLKLGTGRYQVSIPQVSVVKMYLQPGP